MKAPIKMCRIESRSVPQSLLGRLMVALLIGILAQHALTSRCLAEDAASNSSDHQLTAALPEAGAPPAPAARSEPEGSEPKVSKPEDSQPVLPGDVAPESSADQAVAPAITTQAEASEKENDRPAAIQTDKVRELSVSPELKPLLPADRPAWVGAPPDLSNSHRHRLFVGSLPSSSIEEAEATLDQPMVAAVRGYIDEQVLGGHGANELDITADFIRHNLLDRSTNYVAELSTSSGPMYQKWVVLEITPEQRQYFVEAHRQVQQRKRMVALGLGLAAVMGLTGCAHVAFNRRRRRYGEPVQPVMHAPLQHLEPEPPQRSGRLLWTLAGCLGGLMLVGLMLVGSLTVVHKSRTTHSMHGGPGVYRGAGQQVIIYADPHVQPPMAPQPPTPPEVYYDTLELRHAVEMQPSPPR